jgi:hypothetical protein
MRPEDGDKRFVRDFVAAWTKVMTADRFDLDQTSVETARVVAGPCPARAPKPAPLQRA